jgi:enterochelin esterase-like enzyme
MSMQQHHSAGNPDRLEGRSKEIGPDRNCFWDAPMASVRDFRIESESLVENRMTTVFLPPGYRRRIKYPVLFCADGQAVHCFSHRLCQTIEREGVPPVILIGVHSSERYRAKEYIHGVDDRRFEAHERFFTDEVYRWTTAKFDLSIVRESCGVFGFSNGGAFALSMGARHREKYGVVIAFSIAGGPDRVQESEYARRPIAKYYLSAGTREKPFCRTGRAVAKLLAKHSVDHVSTERCAGHDFGFWDFELPAAIRWSFHMKNGRPNSY